MAGRWHPILSTLLWAFVQSGVDVVLSDGVGSRDDLGGGGVVGQEAVWGRSEAWL